MADLPEEKSNSATGPGQRFDWNQKPSGIWWRTPVRMVGWMEWIAFFHGADAH